MIKKILIANRGEIALRIIRTCKEMGIKTVALCPQRGQEDNFIETSLADEFHYLEREGSRGYLDIKRLLEIAKAARVDAIHPGYGFLAENWLFAKLCEKNKIRFVGPHHSVLKKLEDKIEAKKNARKIKIPVLPFSEDSINSLKDLRKWLFRISPPFVLKARRGGGGIGIRAINGDISIGEIFTLALGIKRQTSIAFGDTEFFLEKYLPATRHIEFQFLGDGKNFLHLGERECSIQRRFQKIIEEAPSPALDRRLREEMGQAALKIVKELKYQTAGTVEFLLDSEKNFYFMEINPRIQVEHPVTEAICGIDIIEQQIRIKQGEELKIRQEDIVLKGWAIEARINAEDPLQNFKPSPGKITKYVPPGGQGIFIHTFLHEGQEIFPYFDPLLIKVIGYGRDRKEAILKLKRAVDEVLIEGAKTNIPFLRAVFEEKDFLDGNLTTDFIEKHKILEKIKMPEICKPLIVTKAEISEKEIASIIFQMYQLLKEKQETIENEEQASNWRQAARLEMFE